MRIISVGLLFFSFCVFAQEEMQKLEQLNTQIEALQSQLLLDKSQQEKLQQRLKTLDLSIAQSATQLQKTQNQLEKTQAQLEKLTVQYQEEVKKLDVQQKDLAQQVRSAFLLGQVDTLKLLLNQTDPHAIGRLLTYFDYFNMARSEIIQEVQLDMENLAQIQSKQQQSQEKFKVLLQEQTQEDAQLNEQKQAQTELVAQLLTAMKEKNFRLETLQADKLALESVIKQLKQQSPNTFVGDTGQPLRDHLGQLPWPVQGKVLHRFGDTIVGDNQWQGILIAAPVGTNVHAVYKGRVVYADWLRGLGLILIIDHGQGYMSLYAHNQSLYKNEGDWVEVNEPIAQVGKSGPIANSGLYFEIRSKGEVQNPMTWLLPASAKS